MSAPGHQPVAHKSVVIWLWCIFAMVFAMVVVGGITRLTGSGLSMVEWRPLMGWLPPLNQTEWQRVFGLYQDSPQYQWVNHWMDLGAFKRIFFWEYLHRLLGRTIGIVFMAPWLVFTIQRKLRGRLAKRTAILFVLGGCQGLLGWYMVASGLVDVPEVSHFRLAAHLGLALVIACWAFWLILDLTTEAPAEPVPVMRRWSWGLLLLLAIQIVYGAFMAGKRAGLLYATFPDMNGEYVPDAIGMMEPALRNLVNNPFMIHFLHRTLGWLTLVVVGIWAVKARRYGTNRRQALSVHFLIGAVLLQFGLGVATVMTHVNITLAVVHQAGAVVLLAAGISGLHAFASRADGASTT